MTRKQAAASTNGRGREQVEELVENHRSNKIVEKIKVAPVVEIEKERQKPDEEKWTSKTPGTAKVTPKGTLPFVAVPTRPVVSLGKFKPVNQAKNQKQVAWVEESFEDSPKDLQKGPAFKKKAPIYDETALPELIKQIQDMVLPVKVSSLASISPAMRKFMQRLFTEKRVPTPFKEKLDAFSLQKCDAILSDSDARLVINAKLCAVLIENDEVEAQGQNPLEQREDPQYTRNEDRQEAHDGDKPKAKEDVAQGYLNIDELPRTQFFVSDGSEGIPKGSFVQSDPVFQYIQTQLKDGIAPRPLVVARESQPLRATYPLINGCEIEESLLDGGSSICSVSAEVASRMGLKWDPTYQIFLTSANTQTSSTLGLCRNVPFKFGPVVAYLQLHVLQEVPYKVLLGRPFESLMSATYTNTREGDQTLTLRDPNTNLVTTEVTYPKGKPPPEIRARLKQQEESGFRTSMN